MLWTFLLASLLAFSMYKVGSLVMMISIYTGIVKLAILVIVCIAIYYLYRRYTRSRRGGVPQIPRL